MLKQFLSSIGFGTMKVDTIVGSPTVAFGETLSGTIYIEGGESEQLIDHIEIELLKRTTRDVRDSDFSIIDNTITKQEFEIVGSVKSKETDMIPFEIVPDERWETEENESLILRTTVFIKNAIDVHDEDRITYG
ncbi:sporulation protein [Sporosarcina sp. FSL W7-1349]|uniref:sporulation protein n=1 Tax=Sporosarcina sp. FSL W7-1349 TaxID=2921561 RepID=UPI0030FA2A20